MASRVISQREARRLKKQVEELEAANSARKSRWTNDYPASAVIHSLVCDDVTAAIVRTARMLEHSVVVTLVDKTLKFWGSKL